MITATSTTVIGFNKSPSIACSGFTDVHGIWNKGFTCPTENSIQYFCCGTDTYRYCCSPDRYSFETRFSLGSSRTYNHLLADEISISLLNNQKMINKQFEQFQRYFFPVFLLSTTILFLVGIALWFWLYKHKTFYSLGQDDIIESAIPIDSMTRTRAKMHLTLNKPSRSFSHSSTAV